MRKKHLIFLLTILSFVLIGCSDNVETNTTSGDTNISGGGSTGGGNTGGGSTGGGSTGGGSSSCTGTSSDGVGTGTSLHSFDLFLAGHQPWVPGTYSSSLAQSTMPTVQEASLFFKSDSRLKVRFRVRSQPFPTSGGEYCYGRTTGSASDAFAYTKLRFRMHLRDVYCSNVDPNNSSNCLGGYYLGSRYQSQFIDPVSVNSCSGIIDIGSMRNNTTFGTVVEIEDVKADSTCQANGTFCPAEKIVRTASCWHMTMQVSTDFTKDLN